MFPMARRDGSFIASLCATQTPSTFNALSVLMYQDASEVDGPYTVAEAVYAPHGDWARAHECKAGDYDAMSFALKVRG